MSASEPKKKKSRVREVRPLTTDERASFLILSLYMAMFCLCAFVYWDNLTLKILGVTSACAGVFLFYAAFFNTEGKEKDKSQHPLRSYLISFFLVLVLMFMFRFVGGLVDNSKLSWILLYGGALVTLIIFRKAMIQFASMVVLSAFIFVTVHNWDMAMSGEMKFRDAIHQCGKALFRIGPVQDVANMLIAGNYMNYLNKVDYRDEQINILATREVVGTGDDELLKTKALLDFVSNEIHYVSDPNDGMEFTKDPITTIISGGGDCEDQTLLLCSLLESVGIKTFIAFTDDHVFALTQFSTSYPQLVVAPYVYIDGLPCYALDPADPGAEIGYSSASKLRITKVFDVREKSLVQFDLMPKG